MYQTDLIWNCCLIKTIIEELKKLNMEKTYTKIDLVNNEKIVYKYDKEKLAELLNINLDYIKSFYSEKMSDYEYLNRFIDDIISDKIKEIDEEKLHIGDIETIVNYFNINFLINNTMLEYIEKVNDKYYIYKRFNGVYMVLGLEKSNTNDKLYIPFASKIFNSYDKKIEFELNLSKNYESIPLKTITVFNNERNYYWNYDVSLNYDVAIENEDYEKEKAVFEVYEDSLENRITNDEMLERYNNIFNNSKHK